MRKSSYSSMTGTISHIQTTNPYTVAFEFSGIVTEHNMETVFETINKVMGQGTVKALVLIFAGHAGRAANLRFDARSLSTLLSERSSLDRCAIVGDEVDADKIVEALSPIVPIDCRIYSNGEHASAWQYVNAAPLTVSARH